MNSIKELLFCLFVCLLLLFLFCFYLFVFDLGVLLIEDSITHISFVSRTEVVIYILERSATGMSKRIAASQLFNHLSQNHIKSQLGNLGVVEMVPKLAVSGAQLDAYLDNPPLGYDPRLWRQAKLDNPDPER